MSSPPNVTRLGPIGISAKALYCGRDDGTLWMLPTGGTTWTQLTASPWGQIIELRVLQAGQPGNPNSYDTLYAICSPQFPEHLAYMVVNPPYTWVEINQMGPSPVGTKPFRWP